MDAVPEFTYSTQPPGADATRRLGGFADLLGVQVHNPVPRSPGPADQHGGSHHQVVKTNFMQCEGAAHLQSGFVRGRVVGQPTAVSEALHHSGAGRQESVLMNMSKLTC